jgi:ELWxxDGT repeat protein
MGAVYEAWDLRLERRVALKVLHPHLTAEQVHKDRLLREARLAARVEHPGVVRVYGIHEHEGGLALEMQFVVGTPLHRLLQTRSLSPVQAADLLRQVLEALVACHAQGVIHCDLKPGNLLITPEGKVLLTDFGISRALYSDGEAPAHALTVSGPLWGTPQYCPPEAWDGELPTPSWDLYALGILAHEALAKSLPFNAQTPAVLMREKLDRPHVSIGSVRNDLSPELVELIDSLKATNTGARPVSAEAALELLQSSPELRHESAATQPFRHTVQPDSPRHTPASGELNIRTLSSLPIATRAPGRSWGLHAVWIVVLAVSVVAIFAAQKFIGNSPAPTQPATIQPLGNVGEVLEFHVQGDTAFFSYDNGKRGREIWTVPRSGPAEMVADINPGPAPSNPRKFLSRPAGGFIFSAMTPDHGEELWFCSGGVSKSVSMLQDIILGPMSSEPFPVAAWGHTFMFYATTLQHGAEPWLTNAREGQTGILSNLMPGDAGAGMPPKVLADAGGAYLIGPGEAWHLWRFNHADGSIQEVARVSEQTGEMIVLGDTLFFAMADDKHGYELWTHHPHENGVHLFRDLVPGPDSSDPQQFFVWKDAIYFQAMSKAHGRELWRSDGTPEGTAELLDIYTGTPDSAPYGFVATDDLLFFRARDLAHGQELWVTDGTAPGTRMAFDLLPGAESSDPYNIAVIGELLFFSADDGVNGEELWVLDPADMGKHPRLVGDLWPGPEGSEPHDLTATFPNSGIFVYKTPDGDALMRIRIIGDDIQMEPCSGLIRET